MHDQLKEVDATHLIDRTPPPQRIEKQFLRNDAQSLSKWLVSEIAAQRQLAPADVDARAPLSSFGLDSITIFSMTGELAERLGRDLPATLLWDHPTIDALSAHLAGAGPSQPNST